MEPISRWVERHIEKLKGYVVVGDDEAAHALEDEIHREVLSHIAANEGDHRELAASALSTRDIEFGRWCA